MSSIILEGKLVIVKKEKVSLFSSQVARQAALKSGFRSMKRPGVFQIPAEWDASPSHGYLPAY